jgi:cellulose synthase/poly-beta-1,6-N-acetylglucosamine synthase-like glycosyltransferase
MCTFIEDYANFEIVVLDDNSTDNTAAIVAAMQENTSRLRLIHGEPLPSGWAGKPFACQQLAHQAAGSWLLFVDADTVHEPFMLKSVISMALHEKVSPTEDSNATNVFYFIELVSYMVSQQYQETLADPGYRAIYALSKGRVLEGGRTYRSQDEDNRRCLVWGGDQKGRRTVYSGRLVNGYVDGHV